MSLKINMTPTVPARVAACALALAAAFGQARAATDPDVAPLPASAVLDLSLEELMKTEVTSVSKRSQKLSEVASAVFVISQDDIRRSGATSIPEALRLAPGVQVARISTSKWAISVRGFNGRFANKLQVLMDGRSVYTPLFSGVLWDEQDTLLEDIERIEVIRGPGAAIWGANAVNGVINIITKKARDTQGLLVTASAGTFERAAGAVRMGGKLGEDTHYRVYAKVYDRDAATRAVGGDNNDRSDAGRFGFRLDSDRGSDRYTLQGDIYRNRTGDTVVMPSLTAPPTFTTVNAIDESSSGGNVLARWQRTLSDRSHLAVQASYDRTSFDYLPLAKFDSETFDLDFQHRLPVGARNDVTWGAGYRLYRDRVPATPFVALTPNDRRTSVYSAFVQDDITLIPSTVRLTLGSRFEHNDYTGFEVQPNARLLWTPSGSSTWWAAASRAARTPSRAEADGRVNVRIAPPFTLSPLIPLPTVIAAQDVNRDISAERVEAYELGYRHQFTRRASVDVAAFHNDYSRLRSSVAGTPVFEPGLPPHFVLNADLTNATGATVRGFEVTGDWRVLDNWRLQGSYSRLQMHMKASPPDANNPSGGGAAGANPRHQLSVRSSLDLSRTLEFDLWARYVSGLPLLNVDGYATLDARLGWKPKGGVEISLVGQNLVRGRHAEYVSDVIGSAATVVRPSVYLKGKWQF